MPGAFDTEIDTQKLSKLKEETQPLPLPKSSEASSPGSSRYFQERREVLKKLGEGFGLGALATLAGAGITGLINWINSSTREGSRQESRGAQPGGAKPDEGGGKSRTPTPGHAEEQASPFEEVPPTAPAPTTSPTEQPQSQSPDFTGAEPDFSEIESVLNQIPVEAATGELFIDPPILAQKFSISKTPHTFTYHDFGFQGEQKIMDGKQALREMFFYVLLWNQEAKRAYEDRTYTPVVTRYSQEELYRRVFQLLTTEPLLHFPDNSPIDIRQGVRIILEDFDRKEEFTPNYSNFTGDTLVIRAELKAYTADGELERPYWFAVGTEKGSFKFTDHIAIPPQNLDRLEGKHYFYANLGISEAVENSLLLCSALFDESRETARRILIGYKDLPSASIIRLPYGEGSGWQVFPIGFDPDLSTPQQ